ncbi:MAG TPA: hypothetical protein VK063_12560 [Beutenbergiaceae bacterium]|nr:hypothetical protein [Beutenbergiaceae bacterium]
MTENPRPDRPNPPSAPPVFLNDRVVRTDAMLTMIRTVLVRMLLATLAGALLGSLVGYLIAGMAGVWAALVAAGIGLFFTGTTVVLIYLVVGRGPELLQIVLLGGWILKMAVVLVLLLWLRNLDFYHREVFVGVLILLALALVTVELVTVARTRLPVVDITSASQQGAGNQRKPAESRDDGASETATGSDAQHAPGRTADVEANRGEAPGEDQVG